MEDLLARIYNDPSNPGSYGGVNALLRRARVEDSSATKEDVAKFLRKQDGYTMHRRVVRRFKRRSYKVSEPNRIVQADLADMQLLAKHNDGYRFILVVIDAFSRVLYVRALKNKTAQSLRAAFEDLFANELRDAKLKFIHTDAGTEFMNRPLRELLAKRDIQLMHSDNAETKAAMAERVIRTIKHRIYSYFTQKNTFKWIDVLDAVCAAYNDSYHRTIGTTPNRAHRQSETATIRRRLGFDDDDDDGGGKTGAKRRNKKFKFAIGNTVRLSNPNKTFKRGFQSQWTREIFVVWKRFATVPHTYVVRDSKANPIRGAFYAEEMQSVDEPEFHKVEKILGEKTVKGVKFKLVKWLGYPDSFNSWEPASEVRDI